jgi:hypothetical protein
MKKRLVMNNHKIKKIVSEKLKQDGTFIKEDKIDKAIKDYLNERKDNQSDFEGDENSFSPKAKKAFGDMIRGLNDIVEDLRIIQVKEPDILVDDIPGAGEFYSEDAIEEIVNTIESVLDNLEYLKNLNSNV